MQRRHSRSRDRWRRRTDAPRSTGQGDPGGILPPLGGCDESIMTVGKQFYLAENKFCIVDTSRRTRHVKVIATTCPNDGPILPSDGNYQGPCAASGGTEVAKAAPAIKV